jgi:hypothetical protein
MKYCHQCGASLDDSARFCTACGAPMAQPPVQSQGGRAPIPPPPPGYRQILGQEGAPAQGAPPPGQAPAATDIDYEAAFKFATKTDGWIGRMFLLGFLMLVPILNFFVIGYLVELARDVFHGRESELPEIKIGPQFSTGIMFLLALLIFGILSAVASFVVAFLSVFVSIAIQLYMKPALAIAVAEDNPWAVFQFSRAFNALSKNFVTVLLLVLMDMVIGIVGALGLCALLVGVLVTLPYSMTVSWHLTGQLGRIIKSQGL